jgi:hypothetical protein
LEASGAKLVRPYLKNKLKNKRIKSMVQVPNTAKQTNSKKQNNIINDCMFMTWKTIQRIETRLLYGGLGRGI